METIEPIYYLIGVLSLITVFKYLIYIFSGPFYSISQAKHLSFSKYLSKKEIEDKIKISVIVPAWNEEVGVISTIKSLLESNYTNLEIILINDGSSDSTCKIVNNFKKLR